MVEFPDKSDPNSLYGKSCKNGFNSHYVTLSKHQGGTTDYIPCNPDEIDPEFDEIVIFNPDQILPCYLVHYSRQSGDLLIKRHILWVHSQPDGDENSDLKQEIEKGGAKVSTFSTSLELMNWLRCSSTKGKDIRIISSKYREGDGEESAGVRLCQQLQLEKWSEVPFMLFCEDASLVKGLIKGENIFITKNKKELLKFALH